MRIERVEVLHRNPITNIALPRVMSFTERRSMTQVDNRWVSRFETEDAGKAMATQVTKETLPIDVVMIPRVYHTEDPDVKRIVTHTLMVYYTLGDIINAQYG